MPRSAGSSDAALIEALEPRNLLAVAPPLAMQAWLSYRQNPFGSTTLANISWSDTNNAESGYRVEYTANGGATWQPTGPDTAPNATSATQVLDAGQKYDYRVRAVQGTTVSAPSMILSPITPRDHVVEVSASTSPGVIELAWPYDPDAVSYRVWRKTRSAQQWTLLTAFPLAASTTGYADFLSTQTGAVGYEYQVERMTANLYGTGTTAAAYGYVYAGISLPTADARGAVLVLVDQTLAPFLQPQLDRYRTDLIGDGWSVQQVTVVRDNDDPSNARQAAQVKQVIRDAHRVTPGGLQSIVIVGHVAVPYSGTTAWDGHTNHQGAWPADAYYGHGLSGTTDAGWTDTGSAPNLTRPQNNNLPGDGKFDQNMFPAAGGGAAGLVPVGRIDFWDLPGMSYTFDPRPTSAQELEVKLLQRYFDKNHAWRIGEVTARQQALVDDHIGGIQPQNGWRNFSQQVGADAVYARDWQVGLRNDSFLWAYGAGPGAFDSVHGVTTIFDIHSTSAVFNAAFTMLFGSYFGDWNTNQNVMRELVASLGMILTSAWVGTPNWTMHTTALGETIGQGLKLTLANAGAGPYAPVTTGTQGPHIALIGDPTLRTTSVRPPSDPVATSLPGEGILLTWTAAPDAGNCYYVYRATSKNGPFTRITPFPVTSPGSTQQVYLDSSVTNPNVRYTYMIRTTREQVTASGSFMDLSVGVFVDSGPWHTDHVDSTMTRVSGPDIGIMGGPVLGNNGPFSRRTLADLALDDAFPDDTHPTLD